MQDTGYVFYIVSVDGTEVSDIHSFEDILLLGCQRFQAVSQSYQGLPTFFIE